MRRPQSAKPGYNGYWGQGSESEIQQQQNTAKGAYRKNVKMIKPDLTTNDFARILPKKFYQDKQRLYSQALQLKQNLNETLQQNIRLKTRVTILEKQKDKLGKHLEAKGENSNANKGNSRVHIFSNKTGEVRVDLFQKQNMMIRNLKKLVREGKEENEFLKQENGKIKKAIKYTKINELQIERKMLQDENRRIANLLDQMNNQLHNQDQFLRQISQLKRKNEYQNQAYQQLSQANLKYEEYVQELQEKLQTDADKFQTKENKMQRQLALTKRKLNETTKQTEDLKKELNALRLASSNIKPQSHPLKTQLSTSKNDALKPKLARPMSSNPYKSHEGLIGVRLTTESRKEELNKQNEQNKMIQVQNERLKEELNRTKIKLQETERQMQRQKQNEKQVNGKEKNNLLSKKITENKKSEQRKRSFEKQTKVNNEGKQTGENKTLQEDEDKYYDEENYDQNYEKDQNYQDEQKYQTEEKYENEFEQKSSQKISVSIKNKKLVSKETPQIDQYRKDFQAEEEQEPLYIKQESPKKKSSTSKNQKDQVSSKDELSKKKKEKKQNKSFKPDKKFLSEIKQLLSYRMKAQRYPYNQLKRDIEQAQEKQFRLQDLKGMLINEPFYLTPRYAETLIQYCFQSQKPGQEQRLSNQTLLTKLRKVIEDFQLIQQKEEEEMLLRIAEMVTEYPQELETAFQKIKNGQETVPKQELIEMFQNLQLQQKYIELIIQQLSLCSADLDHLNFIGFFQRFYVQNISGVQNGQIDEQQMQSSSQEVSKNLKSKDPKKLKQIQDEFEDNNENLAEDNEENISLGNGDNIDNDDADVVSDDGPI